MDIATCTENNHTYTATEFAKFNAGNLERMRRQLICSECERPAFFRKESRDGRGACFGARPHAEGCSLAAQDNELVIPGIADDEDEFVNDGNRIVIDLNFGGRQDTHLDGNPNARRRPRGGNHVGDGGPGTAVMHRRPSGLLRMLVDAPNFRYSDQIIEIANEAPMPVRDFCVELNDVSPQYERQFRAYWGELTDAGLGSNGTLWLNSGGREQVSFGLKPEHQTAVMQRYRLHNYEEFAGAYILVFGYLAVSGNGKMYCIIEDLEFLALR